jgi:septal ring factor EnvC (AmiA/AmiB activator)
MNFKKMAAALAVALILGAGIVAVERTSMVRAADGDISAVSQKLDQVLNNQKGIMDAIASVKEELNVIKIRITQTQ